MTKLADAAADSANEPGLLDDTARRIMTARFIADEILRGSKRVSLKTAKALADGFVARDRQAAAANSELQDRRARELTAEDREALAFARSALSIPAHTDPRFATTVDIGRAKHALAALTKLLDSGKAGR